MANFVPILNEFIYTSSKFNEVVQDEFGSSISNEVLEPTKNILNYISQIEENEKKVKMYQIEQRLSEARSILP
jgi:hypothetical protein